MKVLRVYHSAVVSAWRQRDRELRALGHDVTLVSATRWNEGGTQVDCTPGGDAFVVPVRTWGSHPYLFVYDPRPLWRLLGEPCDLVDIHEEPASLAALEIRLLMLARRMRTPFLLYCAQNIRKRYPIPFRWFERSALRTTAAVYCCNEDAARILRKKGLRGRADVIGLGVDVERFVPRSPATGREVVVGYVGRLEEHKGVHVLIEAVAKVPDAFLVIVGDGPYRVALEATASRFDVADRVHFEGYAAHDDLPAAYRRFDVVAIPSLPTSDWIEQFGRVAVEAMASGVPVVASDSGSLPEVIGDAGVLVEPGDAAALADALCDLAADPSRRNDLAVRGVERAKAYSWAAIAAAHSALYEAVTP